MQPLIAAKRIESIDVLRGLIIVIMALDHVRDYFGLQVNPTNLSTTTPLWFFTRWITHYCAPGFVFLAGLSAYLYGKIVGREKLNRFLLSRGIWLIAIEFTVVHFGWTFSLSNYYFVQVIWAIGWSMIIMSVIIYLPRWLQVFLTVIFIAGHNVLDGIQSNEYWWQILHQQRWSPPLIIAYPLIPWPAVMAFGFLMGNLYIENEVVRRKRLVLYGTLGIVLFVALRSINQYGDPSPWVDTNRGIVFNFLSFLNTTKYPPSLQYLAMTLGPILLMLAVLEGRLSIIKGLFLAFGRVPFFFYIGHIYVIHVSALLYYGFRYGQWQLSWFFANAPEGYHPSLWLVYAVWIIVVCIMYPLCHWFMRVKSTHTYWWLKYL